MIDERRIQPRIPVNPEFVPVIQSEGFFVQDLSTTGLFLRTKAVYPVDSVLRLRFSVLVDDVFVFDLQARVARIHEGHPAGLGMELIDVDAKTKAEIEQVLRLSKLRHRWEEGAEVTRQAWDEAQRALRAERGSASAVEFAPGRPQPQAPAQASDKAVAASKDPASTSSQDDEVTRVFDVKEKQ